MDNKTRTSADQGLMSERSQGNDNAKYWAEVWGEICSIAESKYFTFDCYNPHILIKDLLNELELNSKDNQDNRKFFLERLGSTLREDPATAQIRTELASIIKGLTEAASKEYMIHLCQTVLQSAFASGRYYWSLCKSLKISIADSSDDKNLGKIHYLSRSMIIELWLHGYTFENVRGIPRQIMDEYQNIDDVIVRTQFPHGVKWDEYAKHGENGQVLFYAAIKQVMDKLDLSQRLDRLAFYVSNQDSKDETIWYIFPVKGIQRHDELRLGNVIFYSPTVKRLITQGYFGGEPDDEEFFGRKATDSDYDSTFNPIMNAAVSIQTSDRGREKHTAIAAIYRAFDLFRLHEATPARFKIDTCWYICAELDGRPAGSNSSSGQEMKDALYGYNLSEFKTYSPERLLKYKDLISGKIDNDIKKRLTLGLQWHRKAVDSDTDEDRVLHNWISLESLFASQADAAPIRMILEKLPYVLLPDYILTQCQELVHHIAQCLRFKKLKLPDSALEQYGISFDPITRNINYNRSNFVKNLPALQVLIDSKRTQERLMSRHRFFSETDAAQKELLCFIENLKADIISVYRHRNRIVHNAQIEGDILPLVANKAHYLTRQLLEEMMESYVDSEITEMRSALTFFEVKVKLFLAKLATKQVSSVWNYFDEAFGSP